MWFTAARSNTYSPSPARLAPGVRATCRDILRLLRFPAALSSTKRAPTASGKRPRLVAGRAKQRPRPPDEEFEYLFRVHDGIEIEALERLRWRFSKLAFRLCAHMPTVHETPGLIGNESPAMGEADLQRGMALEHAAEHETCGRDGGVEWVTDQIAEIIGR